MISEDLYLSAGHCFDSKPGSWRVPRIDGTDDPIPPKEIAKNMHINFNHQVDPDGKLRSSRSFPILELLEYRQGGLDYAIVRLDGKPGKIFGIASIAAADALLGDMLCIISHPEGRPKVIEAGHASDFRDKRIGYNDLDTLGGSSGGGILSSPGGKIVGVHTNGGCDTVGHNFGFKITSLIATSPILSKIADERGTS
jgi:hypothetical protein